MWMAKEADCIKHSWLLSQHVVFLLWVPSPVFIQAISLAPYCLILWGNLVPPRVLEMGYSAQFT